MQLAGVEGEGVGGAVAVGYWLGEAEEGAGEDIGLLAGESECAGAGGEMSVFCLNAEVLWREE